MLLTNAKWLGQDGIWHNGSILLRDSRIASLFDSTPSLPDEPRFDCEGLTVLPGAIDPHVHFREPGQVTKEGLENGAKAALTGGVTTVLDMPNTVPPCSSREQFDAKRHLFSQKAPVNWGLFFDVSVLGNSREWSREERPFGKLYMAKSSPARPVNDIPSVAQIFSDFPIVAIHAEDETCFVQGELVHHVARPKSSIVAALRTIERAWELANPKPRLILCHVGTAEEILWAREMKRRGMDLFIETCAHYLLLTQDDYLDRGNIYKVNPPLRTGFDRSALLEALVEGSIDFIATDHAPHLVEEKNSANPPSGIAGIEWYYPLVFYIAELTGLSERRILQLVCGNASRCFGIKGRNGIKVGNYADLVVLAAERNVERGVVTKAAVNPFAHLTLRHSIKHVLVNGNPVFSNGTFFASPRAMEVWQAH